MSRKLSLVLITISLLMGGVILSIEPLAQDDPPLTDEEALSPTAQTDTPSLTPSLTPETPTPYPSATPTTPTQLFNPEDALPFPTAQENPQDMTAAEDEWWMPTPTLHPDWTPSGEPRALVLPPCAANLSQNQVSLVATTVSELAAHISTANAYRNRHYIITLETNKIYNRVNPNVPDSALYGASAYPYISGCVTILGKGATLSRSSTATLPFRILTVYQGYLRIQNVTISGGRASKIGGAGILNHQGRLEVFRSTIIDNYANFTSGQQILGGGIYSFEGDLHVTESRIMNNRAVTALSDGGGIGVIRDRYGINSIYIRGNEISGNRARGQGNGLYITDGSNSANVTDNCFIGNVHPNPVAGVTNNISVHTGGWADVQGSWWGSPAGPLIDSPATTGQDSLRGPDQFGYSPYRTAAPTRCDRLPAAPPLPPPCPAQTISTIGGVYILIRSRPSGTVVGSIPPATPISVRGGWEHAETDGGLGIQWWWFVEYTGITGYVRGDLIQPNTCPRDLVPPPPLPVPVFNSECYVTLTGTNASVFNHLAQVVGSITNKDPVRVYGINFDTSDSRFLISYPGQPQRWITSSLFQVAGSQYVYGCRPQSLGRFQYAPDGSAYWRTAGYYANTFNAPVSFTTHNYEKFRNSQSYTGLHKGVDLVYGPPDGTGNPQHFNVYAQQNGVIVDAGPSGITGRFVMNGFTYNPLPNRLGTYYDHDNGTLYFAVTWFYDSDPLNDTEETPTGSYRYDNPDFGVRDGSGIGQQPPQIQTRELLDAGGVWSNSAGCILEPSPQQGSLQPLPPGCTGGPDRRVIIWYAENTAQGHPDLQIIYYHVAVNTTAQYPSWRTICSQTNRSDTWLKTVNNILGYAVCRVTSTTYVGDARWIGWSSATHLHYEVWVYDPVTQSFPDTPYWRIDPLTAFKTFR
jgi:hypothetical protein